jgi:hypothetical protein
VKLVPKNEGENHYQERNNYTVFNNLAGQNSVRGQFEEIEEKKESCSTLTRWKEIGINHHIMHVLEDVAKLGGSA